MRRMFRFRIPPDGPIAARMAVRARNELHDFIERGHRKLPVIAAILRPQFRETLAGTQTLDLRQREIFGKPASHGFAVDDLGTAPRRKAKMPRDIGGAADLILMTCDE